MTYENPVGNRAKQIRKYYKMTKREMANEIGISHRAYCDFESGKKHPKNLPGWYVRLIFFF